MENNVVPLNRIELPEITTLGAIIDFDEALKKEDSLKTRIDEFSKNYGGPISQGRIKECLARDWGEQNLEIQFHRSKKYITHITDCTNFDCNRYGQSTCCALSGPGNCSSYSN
jgi:hypothetical protein